MKRPGDVNVKCTLLLMLDHQVGALGPRGCWLCPAALPSARLVCMGQSKGGQMGLGWGRALYEAVGGLWE